MGFLGVDDSFTVLGTKELATSSAPRTRLASRMAFVSTTHLKWFPCRPPEASPCGPPSNWSIVHPASFSEIL